MTDDTTSHDRDPDGNQDHDADRFVRDARELVGQMTLGEKASLCSGADAWHMQGLERLDLPTITVTDGPHGVRLQPEGGLSNARPATCFPTASAMAATWDRELIAEVGRAIGDECLELGVGVLLGPGANLKRSPLCGRNFEYFSEDPYVTGQIAAAFIDGVQSRGVGTSLKHFAGNDQEFRRMTIDKVVDERSLRELELAGFETAVKQGRPWTLMCAYNRLNGTYAAEHPWLLTTVLREEWGHTGIVMTDWGAMNARVASLIAGCELQMPGPAPDRDAEIIIAVDDGQIEQHRLDAAAVLLTTVSLRAAAGARDDTSIDHDAHHALARRAASSAAVLCRNEDAALPITDADRVALLGTFAVEPRYQGTGSSRMSPTRLDTLLTELTALIGEDRIAYAPGYSHPTRRDDDHIAAAVAVALGADVAVICVGLPDGYENEGADRTHLRLPATHDALIAAVAAVHDRVVVVLSNGAPVEMPWIDDVEAVVEGYLGGQAGGGGLADVLTGTVNPSGRLAETFPRHLADTPSGRHFPGGPNTVEQREGLYVGYRYHDTVGGDVLFPFGHGLSYTTFAIGDVSLDVAEVAPDELADGGTVTVSAVVSNTGAVSGREVVQVYVRDVSSAVYRPDRELKGFTKVTLEPGASTRVDLELDRRAFAFWDTASSDWVVEPGDFEILVGASSRDIRGSATLQVTGVPLPVRDEPAVYRRPGHYLDVDGASFAALLGRTPPPNPGFPRPFDRNTPIGATASTAAGKVLVRIVERQMHKQFGNDPASDALVTSMIEEAPLRTMQMGGVTEEQIDTIIDLLNGRWGAGGERVLRQLRRSLDRD